MTRGKSISRCNPSKSSFRAAHSKNAVFNPHASVFQLRPRSKFPLDFCFLDQEAYVRSIPIFSKESHYPIEHIYYLCSSWAGTSRLLTLSEVSVLDNVFHYTDSWHKRAGYSAPITETTKV